MRIPLYRIFWDDDDIKAVVSVLSRGTYWTMGPEIEELERALAEYVGVRYAVTFNSGTSALHAALLSLKVGPGDEVIVPSFTFIATANAALFVGSTPIFADIEEETLGLDPGDVERRITGRTKVIMPIHYGGTPCKIEELKEVAERKGIALIEDAAEALGAEFKGRKVGSFGDCAIVSFCGNKVITTGEGGAVVTDSREIYERLKLIRSHGRIEYGGYFEAGARVDYVELGYNWRMSSITAALGLSQLRKLDKAIELRRKKAVKLTSGLANIKGVLTPKEMVDCRSIYQMYTIRVKGGLRDPLKRFLEGKGITVKVYFEPVHLTTLYRKLFSFKEGLLPITEAVSKEVLTLPIYPSMTDDEISYIITCIKEFMEEHEDEISKV
ncbi:DegT/DnrJ/EryC1/StrS family aminotransferase [Candidatus Woesearchaeota archaeon]|nr:MAG: DegT/DnrJ/EryC1/StrS family aminotransferase [Candidatus Woesearchaeota archaeon]